MKHPISFAKGLLVGAGLMYLFDPRQGGRRRALVRDQMTHAGHELEHELRGRAKDVGNRARGRAVETAKRRMGEDVEDDVLEDRVRAALGHELDSLADLRISAEHGRVTLAGSAPSNRISAVVERTREVRGVREVVNLLSAEGSTRHV